MTEIPLGGGWSTDGVVRVGDTVRRPSRFPNQLMRDVLVELERVGFDAAPRWLGFDEQGRDVLTWVEGDDYSDTRSTVFADEQLAASARLLRRYHDAVAGSHLARPCDVVCHGDYGPWNLIWRDGLPFSVIDFDTAHPGSREDDLGYALWKHLNLGLVDVPPVEQARRAALFSNAYGLSLDVANVVERAHEASERRFTERGWHDALPELAADRRWFAAHRAVFAAPS